MKYRNYFFDLDGTLADTDADIRLAWKAALKALALTCPTFDRDFIAGPPIDVMTQILFPDQCTPKLCDAIRQEYARAYDGSGFPTTREYPGVRELLTRLKAAGARLFIVTNKRHPGTLAMAAKFGWGEFFEGIYSSDMYRDDPTIGKLKKPELLRKLLFDLHLDEHESVMVGDTINDFEAATINGLDSIGVSWGYGSEEELKHCTYRVSAPMEIG